MHKVDDCRRCGREYKWTSGKTTCSRCTGFRPKEVLKAQRDAVARDGKCVECGRAEHLHGHHILSYRERPDLGADLSNIIALCVDCHAVKHPLSPKKFFRDTRKEITRCS